MVSPLATLRDTPFNMLTGPAALGSVRHTSSNSIADTGGCMEDDSLYIRHAL
jgi:hypothetical protein